MSMKDYTSEIGPKYESQGQLKHLRLNIEGITCKCNYKDIRYSLLKCNMCREMHVYCWKTLSVVNI